MQAPGRELQCPKRAQTRLRRAMVSRAQEGLAARFPEAALGTQGVPNWGHSDADSCLRHPSARENTKKLCRGRKLYSCSSVYPAASISLRIAELDVK